MIYMCICVGMCTYMCRDEYLHVHTVQFGTCVCELGILYSHYEAERIRNFV